MIENKNEINPNALSDEQMETISGGYLYIHDPVGEGLLTTSPFRYEKGQEVNVLARDNNTYRAIIVDRRVRIGMNLSYDIQYKASYIRSSLSDEWVWDYLINRD
ncbi:MAG: hypothetical protein ACI4J1_08990 [Ruminiclostridium sp.]